MATRNSPVLFLTLAFVALTSACSDGGTSELDAATDLAVAMASEDEAIVRTPDLVKRGLSETDFPRVKQIADGVYTYEGLREKAGIKFTTTNLFVVTSDGVLVADAQGTPAETQGLIDAIAEVTDQPIKYLVIGTASGDHTGGNSAFPAGVEILGNAWAAEALAANEKNREPSAPPVPQVTESVRGKKVLHLGGKEIQVLFLGRAHTPSALNVYLPAERVLFMSEAYLPRIFPALGAGFPSEWLGMLVKAKALKAEYYIPGHGFVESPKILQEELEAQIQAHQAVMAELTRLFVAGVPVEDAVANARFGELENWALRDAQAPSAIRTMYEELEGKLAGN